MKTIGEFYREKVLSLPEDSLTITEIPYRYLDNMEVKQEIFGWKIFYTKSGRKKKEFLECRSEEEARYLKALIDSGMNYIRVPNDEEYLKNILPELEKIKRRIDEILNSYMETILNRSKRMQLKYEVFMEITK